MKNIVKTELYARFMHVIVPKDDAPYRVQAVSDGGKLVTSKCSPSIYQRVLGERRGEKNNQFSLGLRRLMHVQFRAHKDETDTIQSLDIVPNRYFTSGAAPRLAGDNVRRGFDIHLDEDLDGFDVWTEDPIDGKQTRVTYAGLAERPLFDLLDALRAADWGDKKTINLLDHRFEKIEEGLVRCRPLKDIRYTT